MTTLPDRREPQKEPVTPLRVLIADDHPIVRSGVRNELARHPDIEVVGEAMNGDETVRQVEVLHPDVVLLDINMPGLKAIQVARQLQVLPVPPRILVLTAYGDLDSVLGMLEAGVTGYLLKDEDPSAITQGVRAVAQGEIWLSSAVTQSLVGRVVHKGKLPISDRQTSTLPLSVRELEVLRLLGQGYNNKQIADTLAISEGTVKNHVTNIYAVLKVHSRAEAVVWAWQQGLMNDK